MFAGLHQGIRRVWEVIIQFVAGRKRVFGSRISLFGENSGTFQVLRSLICKIFTFSMHKCTKRSNVAFFQGEQLMRVIEMCQISFCLESV